MAWCRLPLRLGAFTLGETRVGGAPSAFTRECLSLGSPLTGCPYDSPPSFLLSFPLPPFPHSLGRGGGPKGLSRTAAWRTGQPCSPRPDDPGPSPGTSSVGLAPACPPEPGRGDCPLGACGCSGTLEESGRRQALFFPPALIALGPRQRGPGRCFVGAELRGHLACRAAPSAISLGPPNGGIRFLLLMRPPLFPPAH